MKEDQQGFSIKELKMWTNNPLINPRTNRKIKKNGPTYQKLNDALKSVQNGGNKYSIGIASLLPKDEDRYIMQQNNGFLWASIFDGHGGKTVSTFLKENAVRVFKKISESSASMEESLAMTYEILEKSIKQNNLPSGSTGSTLLIHPKSNNIYIAHVGDSRIIAKKGNSAVALTNDHKPNQMSEYKRIRQAGDNIVHHGVWRIGSLAVSRVFGDLDVKRQYPSVISTPDIRMINIKGFNYFVLASDGLYDVCSNEEIIKFIEIKYKKNKNLNIVAKELANYAQSKGSMDDITILIVRL